MAEAFDPYLRWLGIRDPQRPPNHYRLLGLEPFENDREVIAVAADRQMTHVRTFQTGKLAAISQRLLNELSASRICLLKPEKKAAYDEQLRRQLAAPANVGMVRQATSTAKPTTEPATKSMAAARPTALQATTTAAERIATLRPAVRPASRLPLWVAAGVGTVCVGVLAIWLANQGGGHDGSGAPQIAAASPSPGATGSASVSRTSASSGATPAIAATAAKSSTAPPLTTAQSTTEKLASTSSLQPSDRPADSTQAAPHLVEKPVQVEAQTATAAEPRDDAGRPPQPRDNLLQQLVLVETPSQPIQETERVARADQPAVKPTEKSPAADIPASGKQRVAPPGKEAKEAAEKVVLELFGADLDQANRGGADAKAALAKKLIKQAGDTTDDAAARFVIYQKARDLAVAAGAVMDAMAAIDKLAEGYTIDIADDRFAALSNLAKNTRSQDAAQAVLDAELAGIDEAIAADNFDVAGKLVRMATASAAKLHNTAIVSQLKGRPAEIEQIKKEFAKAAEAMAKLKTAPEDPAANFTVGFYAGPMKGDFQIAIDHLAKGSDPVFRDIAKKELAAQSEPSAQAKLANAWWDAAERQREPAKSHIRAHAGTFYKDALPSLKGLSKAQAESRLKQLENERPAGGGPNRGAVVKALTTGEWNITWFESATEESGPVTSEYRGLLFNADGTWKHKSGTGNWRMLDPDSTIELNYGDFIWRLRLVGDTLHCAVYRPPTVLNHLGLGKRN